MCCVKISPLLGSLSLGYRYGDADGEMLYYLPSGHRTESHIPHLSPPVSLRVASSSPTNARSSSPAIPSRLLFPFFHPAGVHVCFYSHLCVTAARRASHCFLSSAWSPSALSLPPFPLPLTSSFAFLSVCVLFYYTLLFCRRFMPFTWEPYYPSLRALSCCLPRCLSVCAVS